jgi:hypothetical protein
MSMNDNRDQILEAITEMLDELTNAEMNELEDFIVNHCNNDTFVDDEGNYPNLFRIFVTGTRED